MGFHARTQEVLVGTHHRRDGVARRIDRLGAGLCGSTVYLHAVLMGGLPASSEQCLMALRALSSR